MEVSLHLPQAVAPSSAAASGKGDLKCHGEFHIHLGATPEPQWLVNLFAFILQVTSPL